MEFTSALSRQNLVHSFLWMTIGLILTAVTSIGLLYSGFILTIFSIPYLTVVLALVQIGLVLGMGFMINKLSVQALIAMFLAYSVLTGVNLTPLAFVYTYGSIGIAFGVAAFYFLCLTLIGLTTKVDLTRIGNLCLAGLFALMITSVFMLLFNVDGSSYWMAVAGLLIFTGLTAWDVQRANKMLAQVEDGVTAQKLSIYFALELYLDFINLFLYILQLLGKKK